MLLLLLFFQTGEVNILFLGDSLTAGYGLDPQFAFPAIIGKKIDEMGISAKVRNAGVSGDTTAGGLRRLNWLLKQEVDVLVLALGANDGLRGIPSDETKKNLLGIITKARERYPEIKILLCGMKVPPNMGLDFAQSFEHVFIDVEKVAEVNRVPFLLEGVAGNAELNLADGIHPNAKGQQKVAEHILPFLLPLVKGG